MSKKIQYREKESSEWQTITPADVKAAPEKHNHAVNDINGVLPIDKGGTGQSTLEEAPFVKKGNSINTAYIDADWNKHQPINIWTHSPNQTVTSNYGLCINTTNPFLFNENASPQTIWNGVTDKNIAQIASNTISDKWINTKWEKCSVLSTQGVASYPSIQTFAIYFNNFLNLLYINMWLEGSATNFRQGWSIVRSTNDSNWFATIEDYTSSYFKKEPVQMTIEQDSSSPLYRSADSFTEGNYTSMGLLKTNLRYSYYLGTASVRQNSGILIDANMFLVVTNINNKIGLVTSVNFPNITQVKFQAVIPYKLLGISPVWH